MFSTEAARRLSELQSKALLTRGEEEIEVKHLIDMKWRATRAPGAKPLDMEALARAAAEAMNESKRTERLKDSLGQ